MATIEAATPIESPLRTLRAWIDEARALGVKDPDAMTVATVNNDGRPSARVVLCRKLDDDSVAFFTNYESQKGDDLSSNPRAAVVFHWRELERQVRVEGDVARTSAKESDDYFAGRPRGSQIAASVSPQSRVVASVDEILARHAALEKELAGSPVTRPPHWGGYRITATAVELWRSGESRMHDRRRYEKHGSLWTMVTLAP